MIYLPKPQKTLFVRRVKEKSNMKSCRFQKSVWLPATPSAVFAFHENPQNLREISPRSLRVRRISAESRARVGARFEIEATQFGLPIHWIGSWEQVVPDRLLVDVAERGPFPVFRHFHRFDSEDGGTRMTDTVEYALPLGWIGFVLGATGGWLALVVLFFARHRATRKWFARRRG